MSFLKSLPRPVILVVLVILVVGGLQIASAFSIREFLGLEKKEEAPPQQQQTVTPSPKKEPVQNTSQQPVPDDTGLDLALDYDEVQLIMSLVDENQRKTILADENSFKQFIENEAGKKSLLAAAHANRIDQQDRNRFAAKRSSENIYRDIYLSQLLQSRMPEGFPSEEQMQTYYDNNKERFMLDERVHVWQIFLPKKPEDGTKEVELLKKKAESIITDINKKKIDFADAAKQHSVQGAGKFQGGYMGLLNVSEIRPEIKKILMDLEPDKLSTPVETDTGVQIFKRSKILPKQQLEYDVVKNNIQRTLRRQFRNQLRQNVLKQAVEVYPSGINEKTIEEWRLKLRTQSAAQASSTQKNQAP